MKQTTTLKEKRKRAILLFERAKDAATLATTKDERDLATHQYNRALAVLQRINNAIRVERENKQTTHYQTNRTRIVRVQHPITHRYVKVTQEKADEWQRQHP